MTEVVFTNKAMCRDCYRCVRVCPVKAIKFMDGQAFVQKERCVSCGACIKECPQGAKQYRRDIEKVIALIEAGEYVVASVAPSYPSFFNEDWERNRFPSILRAIGFKYISETAIGAEIIAELLPGELEKNGGLISPACPALVKYIELYRKDSQNQTIKILSPMAVHAKYLRKKFDRDIKVVFIGPCAAKKAEADNLDAVDCAITFEEIGELMKARNMTISSFEDSFFDETCGETSRLYPLSGGMFKLQFGTADIIDRSYTAVSGFDEIKEALESIESGKIKTMIEPLFCRDGCINGPGFGDGKNVFKRRADVIKFSKETNLISSKYSENNLSLEEIERDFKDGTEQFIFHFSEEEIQKLMEKTGKVGENNQLNCGACGYASCRDQAIAALSGMADPEMCIPYMRRLAEQKTYKILDADPNGLVIVNEKLLISFMNPSFKKMFMCDDSLLGQRISILIDPSPFETLISKNIDVIETTQKYDAYNLICHQLHYTLPEENKYAGVFVNTTFSSANTEKLRELREKTIMQAREMLDHQTYMAQEMAKFLGENTARGEQILRNLLDLVREKQGGKGESWLWDIYTSK